jgi:hypothetical protein
MEMTFNDLRILIIALCINAVIGIVVLVTGLVRLHDKKETLKVCFRFAFIMLAPFVGALYLACSVLFRKTFFHKEVDLSDVIFSKDKIRQVEKSDMEQEINYAPIEEAIAVSDTKNQRQLMMNVLRSDIRESLGSISLALNSQDSEVSHYAASALRDELGDFRSNVQRIHQNIETMQHIDTNVCIELIEYIYPMLDQDLFPELEQRNYVSIFDETLTLLSDNKPDSIKDIYYEWIVNLLIDLKDYEAAKRWCDIALSRMPHQLIPYKCLLKYYYSIKDKDNFFTTMEQLKQSDIPIDSNTLETFRIFN